MKEVAGVNGELVLVEVPGERRWTPLDMKRTLVKIGRWAEVKAMLVQADKFEDFLMCDNIYENDDDFKNARAWANEHYGAEAVDAILDMTPTTEQ